MSITRNHQPPYALGSPIKVLTEPYGIGTIHEDRPQNGGCLVKIEGYPHPFGFGYKELEPISRLERLLREPLV